MTDVIEGLDGKTTLVKNFNFEKNVTKVYNRNTLHLLQDSLSVTLTKYLASIKIDEMNAEHCDGKL